MLKDPTVLTAVGCRVRYETIVSQGAALVERRRILFIWIKVFYSIQSNYRNYRCLDAILDDYLPKHKYNFRLFLFN